MQTIKDLIRSRPKHHPLSKSEYCLDPLCAQCYLWAEHLSYYSGVMKCALGLFFVNIAQKPATLGVAAAKHGCLVVHMHHCDGWLWWERRCHSRGVGKAASAHILEDTEQDLVAQVGHADVNVVTWHMVTLHNFTQSSNLILPSPHSCDPLSIALFAALSMHVLKSRTK